MISKNSVRNITEGVFTPDYSSIYRKYTADTPSGTMLTTNVIKQSATVDLIDNENINDSEYKIKEAEKIISKNILYAIYNFNISSKYCNYSNYIGQHIHTYNYTNLDNPEIPSFKKLNLYLDEIGIILNNHNGIIINNDIAIQLCSTLQEFIEEIKECTIDVYSLVMDNKIYNVTADNFIINSEKLFKGVSEFNTKRFIGDNQNVNSYFDDVKTNYCDIAKSVAGYNDGLHKVIIKLNNIMNRLSKSENTYSQLTLQINGKKEELRKVLYTFAMKYLNAANILYSIKASCICEYLQPSSSDYDDIKTFEDKSFDLDEYDIDDNFDESFDFEKEFVDFSYKTIELETAFFGYNFKTMLLEADTATSTDQPKPNSATSTDQPKPNSADVYSYKDPGGETTGFASSLQSLWNTIMEFLTSLFNKLKFATTQASNKLNELFNNMSSMSIIAGNLVKSDDGYSYKVYSVSPKKVNERINTIKKFPTIQSVVGINSAQDVEEWVKNKDKMEKYTNPSSSDFAKMCEDSIIVKNGVTNFINGCYKQISEDINTNKNNNDNKESIDTVGNVFKEPITKKCIKNYFAGYEINDVTQKYKDIKDENVETTKKGILSSIITVGQLKQMGVEAIKNDIQTIPITNLINNSITLINQSQSFIDRLGNLLNDSAVKKESVNLTVEKVLEEYFAETEKVDANTNNKTTNTNNKTTNNNTNTNNKTTNNNNTNNKTTNNNNTNNKTTNNTNTNNKTTNNNTNTNNNNKTTNNNTNEKVDGLVELRNLLAKTINVYCNGYVSTTASAMSEVYSQLCNNYYNIFNALLESPLQIAEQQNNQQQPQQNNQQNNQQQPQQNNQQNNQQQPQQNNQQ